MTEALLQDFLTQAVMHETVRPYFHVDSRPERLPVTVLNTTPSAVGSLTLFGTPAVVHEGATAADVDSSQDKAVLVLDSVEMDESTARLRFQYPIEGLAVDATFARQDNASWTITTIDAAEQ
ncbi:hypothetical protein [uncultured Rhodospira sp.]|uniref:hypothetical protein n=1 Tax=uncultured Rhodospira sp. TaxID=1936189 RepID=UPI0026323457|nr:hypothetical protein [uncultured Rhodospira sp.]